MQADRDGARRSPRRGEAGDSSPPRWPNASADDCTSPEVLPDRTCALAGDSGEGDHPFGRRGCSMIRRSTGLRDEPSGSRKMEEQRRRTSVDDQRTSRAAEPVAPESETTGASPDQRAVGGVGWSSTPTGTSDLDRSAGGARRSLKSASERGMQRGEPASESLLTTCISMIYADICTDTSSPCSGCHRARDRCNDAACAQADAGAKRRLRTSAL